MVCTFAPLDLPCFTIRHAHPAVKNWTSSEKVSGTEIGVVDRRTHSGLGSLLVTRAKLPWFRVSSHRDTALR